MQNGYMNHYELDWFLDFVYLCRLNLALCCISAILCFVGFIQVKRILVTT